MQMDPRAVLHPGTVFVTGGARGLGNAVACAFAREGCTSIALVDVLPDEAAEEGKHEVEKLGARCIFIRCDVSQATSVDAAVEETVQTFGRIDYAINAAGIQGPTGLLGDLDIEKFEQCLRVNTIGMVNCIRSQVRQMSKQDPITFDGKSSRSQRGAIVNFASVNSVLGGHGISAYATSKHGVLGITKAAALEYRDRQIRINCISPGYIYSAFVESALKANPENKKRWEELNARQGRFADPDEIGDAAVLLCSPRMSLVNAHNLLCDNGFTQNADSF